MDDSWPVSKIAGSRAIVVVPRPLVFNQIMNKQFVLERTTLPTIPGWEGIIGALPFRIVGHPGRLFSSFRGVRFYYCSSEARETYC